MSAYCTLLVVLLLLLVVLFCLNIVSRHVCSVESDKFAYLITLMFFQFNFFVLDAVTL